MDLAESKNWKKALNQHKEDICSFMPGDSKTVVDACKKTISQCMKEPGKHIPVENMDNRTMMYDQKSGKIMFCSSQGHFDMPYTAERFDCDKATEQDINAFIEKMEQPEFSPSQDILDRNPFDYEEEKEMEEEKEDIEQVEQKSPIEIELHDELQDFDQDLFR